MQNMILQALEQVKAWARVNSPWVLHYNTGSCNGCDIELLATITPRYDVERLGIKMAGTPRHADVLIATGPVTLQSRDRLLRLYDQMPAPRFVMAIGACALGGGVFKGSYNTLAGIDAFIPVDVYVPGCPPRPEAIIQGVTILLDKLGQPQEVPDVV
ncbi:MAG: NADH-quinone oxidoreductase subunit B family protein [Anaerolineales bacterium]